jgi:hypothetical protein
VALTEKCHLARGIFTAMSEDDFIPPVRKEAKVPLHKESGRGRGRENQSDFATYYFAFLDVTYQCLQCSPAKRPALPSHALCKCPVPLPLRLIEPSRRSRAKLKDPFWGCARPKGERCEYIQPSKLESSVDEPPALKLTKGELEVLEEFVKRLRTGRHDPKRRPQANAKSGGRPTAAKSGPTAPRERTPGSPSPTLSQSAVFDEVRTQEGMVFWSTQRGMFAALHSKTTDSSAGGGGSMKYIAPRLGCTTCSIRPGKPPMLVAGHHACLREMKLCKSSIHNALVLKEKSGSWGTLLYAGPSAYWPPIGSVASGSAAAAAPGSSASPRMARIPRTLSQQTPRTQTTSGTRKMRSPLYEDPDMPPVTEEPMNEVLPKELEEVIEVDESQSQGAGDSQVALAKRLSLELDEDDSQIAMVKRLSLDESDGQEALAMDAALEASRHGYRATGGLSTTTSVSAVCKKHQDHLMQKKAMASSSDAASSSASSSSSASVGIPVGDAGARRPPFVFRSALLGKGRKRPRREPLVGGEVEVLEDSQEPMTVESSQEAADN